MAPAATIAYKRLASLLADKRKQDYSKTINWLRCSISFSLVKSAVMCLRGARSSFHQPVRQAHCEVPLDVAISEGHVPSQQTMNFLFSVWHSDFFFSPCFCWFASYFYDIADSDLFTHVFTHLFTRGLSSQRREQFTRARSALVL